MKSIKWLVIAFFSLILMTGTNAESASGTHKLTVNITLTNNANNGSKVTINPPGKTCTKSGSSKNCSEKYPNGTPVTLTAVPGPNTKFVAWTGKQCVTTGNLLNPTISVTLNKDVKCDAEFKGVTTTTTTITPTTTTTTSSTTTTTTTSTTTTTLQNGAGNESLDHFSFLPPFLGSEAVKPNILIVVDRSSSMDALTATSSTYDPIVASGGPYIGYFEQDKCYDYGTMPVPGSPKGFMNPSTKNGKCINKWDGKFLNWLTMSRLDITKYALTGGRCYRVREDANFCRAFEGEMTTSGSKSAEFSTTKAGVVTFNGFAPNDLTGTQSISVSSGTIRVSGKTFEIRVVSGVSNQTGVIQAIGDRARLGLMLTDGDQGGTINLEDPSKKDKTSNTVGHQWYYTSTGFPVTDYTGGINGNGVQLVRAIDQAVRKSGTPLYESIYQAARYFAQEKAAYRPGYAFAHDGSQDPYCFASLAPASPGTGCVKGDTSQGRWVSCCRSFVLLFSDGAQSKDSGLPGATSDLKSAAKLVSGHGTHGSTSNVLDDVSYWAHITDLRPTTTVDMLNASDPLNSPTPHVLDGKQNLTLYTLYAFGDAGGEKALQLAAKLGGFDNSNGDNQPGNPNDPNDRSDWDALNNDTRQPSTVKENKDKGCLLPPPGDCIADNYFEAKDPEGLKPALLSAFSDILKQTASGSSASIVASSSSGEGAIYQPYFSPLVDDTRTPNGPVSWVGYLQSFFVDNKGEFREDSVGDGALVLEQDKIIEMIYDEISSTTKVRQYDVDANGEKTSTFTDKNMDEVSPIWEAGKLLALKKASTRKVLTSLDGQSLKSFDDTRGDELAPYLRATTPAQSKNIINFIRGDGTITGFRNREMNVNDKGTSKKVTWKLGDIIYSDPISVGAPAERFAERYHDASFLAFKEKYAGRRNMVYVGANDGMLHAFNGGFWKRGNNPATPAVEHGYFEVKPSEILGEERWGFIPTDLLPHLRWLTQGDYTKDRHVAYVDGSSRVADVQIFTPSGTHPNGWGTILIGSMRMGGGLIKQKNLNPKPGEGEFYSAYFALDITDPEQDPTLLWTFKNADLGFTTSIPTIVRVGSSTTDWYAVFGSGPTTYQGERIVTATPRNKFAGGLAAPGPYGHVYAVNLQTGTLATTFPTGFDSNAFMGDPGAFDLDTDYIADVIYIGKTYGQMGAWNGKMHRILTGNLNTPGSWKLETVVATPGRAILTLPELSRDDTRNPWLHFGTGRFFSSGVNSDASDMTAQGIYSVRDLCWDRNARSWQNSACSTSASISNLLDVTGVTVKKGGLCTHAACYTAADLVTGSLSNLAKNIRKNNEGWVLNLNPGERILERVTVAAEELLAPSYTPLVQNICDAAQGNSTLYALYFQTGTAYASKYQPTGVLGLNGETVLKQKSLGRGGASGRVALITSEDGTVHGTISTDDGTVVSIPLQIALPKQGPKMFREGVD